MKHTRWQCYTNVYLEQPVNITYNYLCNYYVENTVSFLQDYLKSLKKESIKEEIMTELEFTSHFIGETNSTLNDIGEINDDESVENIKDNPEQHSGESAEKDVDYLQVGDSNLTIYECLTCSKAFHTLESLRCHKRIHTSKTFKCKQCDKSYTRLNYLHRHELSHGKRKMHVCKICNKMLTRFEHLKRHLMTHLKEKPFGCPTCNRGFNRAEHLQNHVKCCKGEKVYICDICNKSFSREDSLEVHKRLHENELPALSTLENLDNIEEHYMEIDFDDDTTIFSDQSDGDGGDDLDAAKETMESKVKVSENNDQEKIDEIYAEEDPPEMLIEKAKIEEEMFRVTDGVETKEEEAEVDNGNEYESHASTHTEYLSTKQTPSKVKYGRGRSRKHPVTFKPTARPRGHPPLLKPKAESPKNEIGNFPCPQCKEVFTKLTSLEKHAEQHADLRIHECDSHMKAHFGDGKFRCKSCEKTFISKSHLTEHMKFHNDNSKKFLCSECGQRFIRNDSLVIHMRRHRGEKPFKCKFCGKGFPRTTDLIVHERYHTGEKRHVCVICGRGFRRAYDLTVHMRTHTGEKPYRCTYCDTAFAHACDLKAHIRKHTGERFQCELCLETFLMGYLLTQHKRKVHGLNIVSNVRRLQAINKLNPDDPPPITVSLAAPVVISNPTVSDPSQSQQIEDPELEQEQKSDIM